jgi:drug/metabolite transporter (DMT)-like permease
MLPAILTTLLWSCSSICAARSARMVGGGAANVTRMAVATLLLGVWAFSFGRGLGGPALPWFIASGFIGFGLGDVAMFGALQRIGPRLTMLLTHCLAAPIAAVTEWLWRGVHLSWSEVACAVVILTGVGIALAPDHGSGVSRRTFWLGVLGGLGSAFGQGIGSVLSREANGVADQAAGLPPDTLVHAVDGGTQAFQRIVVGLVVAFIFWIAMRGREVKPAPGVWRVAWVWIIANALAGPSIGVAVFQWGVSTTPTGILMPVVATAPVLTQLLAWWADGTRPTRRTLIGGVIAVGGVVALAAAAGKLNF